MVVSPIGFVLLFVALVNLSIGIYVFRHSPSERMRWAFALVALAISTWTAAIGFAHGSHLAPTIFVRLAFAAASLVPVGVLALIDSFPAGHSKYSRVLVRTCALTSTVFSFLSWSPWIVVASTKDSSGLRMVYGLLHPIYAVHVVAWFAVSAWLLMRAYHASTGLGRLQARHLSIALTVPFALTILTNLGAPLVLRTSEPGKYGPLFSFLLMAMIGHAVIRHRLMDIRVVIRRSAVYATALLTSAAVFVVLLVGSNVILPDEHDFSLREIVLALAVAVCFFPVKAWVQRLFDHYLYRDPYDYQRTLRDTSRALTATIELPALLGHVGRAVNNTMQPESVAIYLLDAEEHEFQLAWAAGGPVAVRI